MRKFKRWATLVLPLFLACTLVLSACGGGGFHSKDAIHDEIGQVEAKLTIWGNGAPDVTLGTLGNYYVDLDSGDVYKKVVDTPLTINPYAPATYKWEIIGTIGGGEGGVVVGPPGPAGPPGPPGEPGASWAPIIDFGPPEGACNPEDLYFDLDNLNIYNCEDGEWSDPYNFNGLPGLQGPPGPPGPPGVNGSPSIYPPLVVVADPEGSDGVRIVWTAVDTAKYYLVYAFKYEDETNTIHVLRAAQKADLEALFGKYVCLPEPPINSPGVQVLTGGECEVFGKSRDLGFVVTSVDSEGVESAGSDIVGSFSGNPH